MLTVNLPDVERAAGGGTAQLEARPGWSFAKAAQELFDPVVSDPVPRVPKLRSEGACGIDEAKHLRAIEHVQGAVSNDPELCRHPSGLAVIGEEDRARMALGERYGFRFSLVQQEPEGTDEQRLGSLPLDPGRLRNLPGTWEFRLEPR